MASKFQQRHYEAIAKVILTRLGIANLSNRDNAKVRITELDAIAVSFDKLFKADNPKYKSDKFL